MHRHDGRLEFGERLVVDLMQIQLPETPIVLKVDELRDEFTQPSACKHAVDERIGIRVSREYGIPEPYIAYLSNLETTPIKSLNSGFWNTSTISCVKAASSIPLISSLVSVLMDARNSRTSS